MPFLPVPANAAGFAAEHNLTMTPKLARMSLRELRAHYNSCCYTPKTNGVVYDVALEEPDMFGPTAAEDGMFPSAHGPRGQNFETVDEPPALQVGYAGDETSIAKMRKIV